MTSQPTVSITPVRGTRQFRRNARLSLADGVFTATDRHGRSTSVPVDGSSSSPRYFATRSDPQGKRFEMAVLDGAGQAIVIGNLGDWDAYEKADLQDALGLESVLRNPEDVPPRRHDAKVLLDSDWWRFASIAGPLGFAAGMASTASDSLRWVGVPVLGASFIYLMSALLLGAFSRPRKGPDWEAKEAWKRGDSSLSDAQLKVRRARREAPDRNADDENPIEGPSGAGT